MQLDEKSISVIRIKTEVTSKHIRYGCVDVTRNWMNNAVPNSHKLKIAKAIILNGKLYNEGEIDKGEILRQCEGIFQRPYVSFEKSLSWFRKEKS